MGQSMKVNGKSYPERSNSEEMADAAYTFEKLGEAMKRRGVHQATPQQALAWALEDEAKERKAAEKLVSAKPVPPAAVKLPPIVKKRKYKEQIILESILGSLWSPVRQLFKLALYYITKPFQKKRSK